MKARRLAFVVIVLIIPLLLGGCSPIVDDIMHQKNVYATVYPIYALSAAIADGVEDLEVHCLVQPQDGCLRSYEMSDWDIYMLAYSADAVLASGNGLESFSDKLESMGENALPLAEVMYGLDLYHMDENSDAESHFSGDNPHVYMSVEGTGAILESIAGSLMVLNEANSALYQSNLEKWHARLQTVQDEIIKKTEFCANIPTAVLNEALFYVAADCGLEISGCFERESGEMLYGNYLEQCLQALEEMGAKLVLIEKQAPALLVNTLEEAGYAVAKLDTMSTMSEEDGVSGYFEVLARNAEAVAKASKMIR